MYPLVTITFAELTTMRVGGPVKRLVTATTTAELIDVVQEADAAAEPLLVMGGGSNLVVGDIGWDGMVAKVDSTNVTIDGDRITADAGVDWDGLVQLSIEEGLAGLEALSGVPGLVGGTPVQNVGAFGTLTSELLDQVRVYDRKTGEVETWGPERCGFGSHRQSVFKHSDQWVVLDVTYQLRRSTESKKIDYAGLAAKLGIEVHGTAPITDVRAAVLELRSSKKMILDPDDHDTWSVGSFFINPVLAQVPDRVPDDCPRWADIKGTKLPAGWLIDHAGFPPGHGVDWGNGTVALSSRHALAVTNRGGATTSDIMKFAAHIREGVEACFGVRLGPECDLVNCSF
jgi:UDP-N-acetylmuramate dehydrogenase